MEEKKVESTDEAAPKSISLDSLSPQLIKLLTKAASRRQGIGPVARGKVSLAHGATNAKKKKKKAAKKAKRANRSK